MHRRKFLQTVGIGSALLTLHGSPMAKARMSQSGPRRNVIFILTDDHRYDAFSFMGHPFLETPNFDRMAANGAHLKNAFVTTSLCSPSRASILTGQYAHRHGVVDNSTLVPEGTNFFPELLQQAGYNTAFIGKWHMGGSSDEPRRGFNHWVSFRGQGRYYPTEGYTWNVNGERVPMEGYVTDELTDYAIDWLDEQNEDTPFFLYLSHKAVHDPFEPAERHQGRYANEPMPRPDSMANTEENYEGKPMWVRNQRNSWHGVDFPYQGGNDRSTEQLYRDYCETFLAVDENVGRLMDYMESEGILDGTLIIYMGDNGFQWGEHGLIDKRTAYEASIRVPMLAHCPDLIEAGSVIEGQVANIDIGPTVLEAAGIPTPDQMDGTSFLQLLSGDDPDFREEMLYEYFWEYSFPHTPTLHALRTNKYKYIRYYGIWDLNELYDLENDPMETTNLFESEEHQDVVDQMHNRLEEVLVETDGLEIPFRLLSWSANLRSETGSESADFPDSFIIPDPREE